MIKDRLDSYKSSNKRIKVLKFSLNTQAITRSSSYASLRFAMSRLTTLFGSLYRLCGKYYI